MALSELVVNPNMSLLYFALSQNPKCSWKEIVVKLDNCNLFTPSLFGVLQDISAMGIVDLVGYKCETAPEMKKKK